MGNLVLYCLCFVRDLVLPIFNANISRLHLQSTSWQHAKCVSLCIVSDDTFSSRGKRAALRSAANADSKAWWPLLHPAENLLTLWNDQWLVNIEQPIKAFPKESNKIIPK